MPGADEHTAAGSAKIEQRVVRPDRLERPTFWFVARRSIQLSYGRILEAKLTKLGYHRHGNWRRKSGRRRLPGPAVDQLIARSGFIRAFDRFALHSRLGGRLQQHALRVEFVYQLEFRSIRFA